MPVRHSALGAVRPAHGHAGRVGGEGDRAPWASGSVWHGGAGSWQFALRFPVAFRCSFCLRLASRCAASERPRPSPGGRPMRFGVAARLARLAASCRWLAAR